jgi:hypothetical protein
MFLGCFVKTKVEMTADMAEIIGKTGAYSELDFGLVMTGFTRSIGLTVPEALAVTTELKNRRAEAMYFVIKRLMDQRRGQK